jgi:2'-5' RNA ligase superfamily
MQIAPRPFFGLERDMETAPVIITAQMGKADQAWANGLRRTYFPPERNYLDAHITLFHHLPPAALPEIKARLATLTRDNPPPESRLCDVMHLGRGVAYRIDSPQTLAIWQNLAECFHGLLIPQDQAKPRLHITIQNKVDPAASKKLHGALTAEFVPRPLAITGLSAFYYRGGPWEAIQTWSFRG